MVFLFLLTYISTLGGMPSKEIQGPGRFCVLGGTEVLLCSGTRRRVFSLMIDYVCKLLLKKFFKILTSLCTSPEHHKILEKMQKDNGSWTDDHIPQNQYLIQCLKDILTFLETFIETEYRFYHKMCYRASKMIIFWIFECAHAQTHSSLSWPYHFYFSLSSASPCYLFFQWHLLVGGMR